jgi:hypothetical protein
MRESDLRSTLGFKYRPSKNTSLDGNVALAKELIATHQQEEVQAWESGQCTEHGQYCLLNSSVLSLSRQHDDLNLLEEDLIKCFVNTLRLQTKANSFGQSITEAIKFDLAKNGHESTFDWINNRYSYLSTKTSKTSRPSSNKGEGPSKTGKKAKTPYPPADQRLLDLINTNLQVAINKRIELSGDDVPTMSDETKLSTFLFKLASEFLRRNKGWHNENSFATPQHLTKLEEYTGLTTKPSEAFLTFSILKGAIDDFRSTFKQRYPKAK